MLHRMSPQKKSDVGTKNAKAIATSTGTPPDIELMTPGEAAQLLAVSPRTLARWRMTGKGPAFMPLSPQVVRYVRADLLKWLNGRADVNTQQPADMMCSITPGNKGGRTMKRVDADAGPYRFDLTTGTPFGTPMARREVAMRYPCPRCGAIGGQRCQGRNRVRKANHIERWEVAANALGLPTR